jgi:hypothetical protein
MASLTLRLVKGTPLTNQEVDDNFSNINTEVTNDKANVGILANLTTTAKSNIVAAINEIASESTSNVTITAGTVAGVIISNSTYQGNTIAAGYGGTGQSSYTTGDLLYASGSAALSKLADVATGNVLRSGGVGAAPAWGKVTLTTDVDGTLPAANGGTGQASYTVGDVLYASGTTALSKLAAVATGNVLISAGTAITSAKILNGTITGTDIAAGTITGTNLGTIDTLYVSDGIYNAGNVFVAQRFLEKANICAYAFGADANAYHMSNGPIHLHTSDATANTVINLKGFETFATGNSVSCVVMVQNGATPYYVTGVVVDGTSANVTVKWAGGSAPTGGNASNVDSYSFSVVKTAALTYSVFAQQTKFGG